jgi:transposase
LSNSYLEVDTMPLYKEMPLDPSQVLLFPKSVDEALAKDSDVRAFNDVMECFDYTEIESKCSGSGCPPYPPKVMVKILGYSYSKGIRSSRKIEEMLKVDVRLIWLAGGFTPDHNTIARFRKENWRELAGLFKDSVRVSSEAGLVFMNEVSTDGSKILAAASKKRVYSQARLERELLRVDEILREADELDRAEDKEQSGASGKVPEHLADARKRKERLEEIAKRLKESSSNTVVESDPDCRLMQTKDGKRPCYNLQASVDGEEQIIVAMKLTEAENDHGQLGGMMSEVEANTGFSPDTALVDCGYCDEASLTWIDESGQSVLMPIQEQPQKARSIDLFSSKCFFKDPEVDALICPAGAKLVFKNVYQCSSGKYREYRGDRCGDCSFRAECVGAARGGRRVRLSVVEHVRVMMRESLKTVEGRKLYAKRRQTVEPVFGQMKSNRHAGRFLCWGLEGASAEAALMCMVHNVLKCAAKGRESACFALLKLFFMPAHSFSRHISTTVSHFRSLEAQAA